MLFSKTPISRNPRFFKLFHRSLESSKYRGFIQYNTTHSGLTLYLELVRDQWTLSLSRTRKGPRDLFEIERVRDREKLVNLRLGPPPRRGVEKPEGPSALQPTTEYKARKSHKN